MYVTSELSDRIMYIVIAKNRLLSLSKRADKAGPLRKQGQEF